MNTSVPISVLKDQAKKYLELKERSFRFALTKAYQEASEFEQLITDVKNLSSEFLVDEVEPTRWEDYIDISSEFQEFCRANDLCL